MSLITLEMAKDFLNVIHDGDDAKLNLLLAAAEDEASQFLGQDMGELTSSSEPCLPASVVMGVLLILQANYQATPDEAEALRKAAEVKLTPYRIGMGV